MNKGMKNHAKSVKTRLLNLMNASGYKYMYLLARYFNERLLYRVSVSPYKDNFLLKGGSLLYAFNGLETRPTVDVDFMAQNISHDHELLEKVVKEILSTTCEEDGVTFDTEGLKSEPITIEKEYPGTRFYITARMDSIVYQMSVDIGFGDVVTPKPVIVDFPLLLEDIPAIHIKAYSLETVVAEKFHTMIVRDTGNSRMKDFFDCYQILTTKDLNDEGLFEAIRATFDNRGLERDGNLQLFTNAFATDYERLLRWSSFLKKIHWKENLAFSDVMKVITTRLEPMYNKYKEKGN